MRLIFLSFLEDLTNCKRKIISLNTLKTILVSLSDVCYIFYDSNFLFESGLTIKTFT